MAVLQNCEKQLLPLASSAQIPSPTLQLPLHQGREGPFVPVSSDPKSYAALTYLGTARLSPWPAASHGQQLLWLERPSRETALTISEIA